MARLSTAQQQLHQFITHTVSLSVANKLADATAAAAAVACTTEIQHVTELCISAVSVH